MVTWQTYSIHDNKCPWMRMETPKWNFDLIARKDVYEPAEDTFLLLDALEEDKSNLIDKRPLIVLEIGPGSGVVITAMSNLFGNSAYCIAIDTNRDACDVTRDTARMNDAKVEIINSSLLDCLDLRKMIDVIIFNPPYVETEYSETLEQGITQSWAGGARGRMILDKLIPSLGNMVSNSGFFYLVAINYNDIDDIMERMRTLGFDGLKLRERRSRGEQLYVLKFIKNSSSS